MKIHEVAVGTHTLVEVRPENGDFGDVPVRQEVDLFWSDLADEALLKIGDDTWTIEGTNQHQARLLGELIQRNLPRVAWVASRVPKTKSATSLVLEVREFPSEHRWTESMDLGVDEKIVADIRRKRGSLTSVADVVSWLDEEVLLRNSERRTRVLLSSAPGRKGAGFRLIGRGIAVDIARGADDRLTVVRVVEGPRTSEASVLLLEGDFQFVDQTVAGTFRGTAQSELDRIVGEAGSYLAIWEQYNELERANLLARAREFGWMSFKSRKRLPNGAWQFELVNEEGLDDCLRTLAEGASFELEAAAYPPAELTNVSPDTEIEESPSRERRRVFAGGCSQVNQRRKQVEIEPREVDDDRTPPESGVLFMSLSGDRTRLERRDRARALIASAQCPMPQLGLLIEGGAVPAYRRRRERPLSAAAKDAFGGDPNPSQEEALRVALETPDIALIQGPPGTGKTRVIAALQTRLSEISEDTEGVTGRYLLTSYQHDAVENVASATQVFGLPAIKLGRRRGDDDALDGFERWRKDRVEAVRARLPSIVQLPIATALRRCRELAVGYLEAPSGAEDIVKLLETLREYSTPHVPPAVTDALLELAQQHSASSTGQTQSGDPQVELAIKAVQGLRTTPGAFSDDGDTQARKALQRLRRLDVLDESEESLLEKAADWDVDVEPDFLWALEALKPELLDRLLPKDAEQVGGPAVNADVEAAISRVLDALGEALRSSPGGVEDVLHEYCEDLEKDIAATREAVERYTVVLAATCQQAVGYQMTERKGTEPFDTVVVDEAARANPLDLFIPMSLAERRIVLVGDHRQLPHILDNEIESDLDSDVTEKTREMLRTSLFQRLFSVLKAREASDGVKRTVTLDTQYRMHPVLGEFVSDTFYAPHGDSERFGSGRPAAEFAHSLGRYDVAVAAWVDMPLHKGTETGRQSKRRPAEAKWIAEEALRILDEEPHMNVGVIAFYSAQVGEILSQLEVLGVTEAQEGGGYRIREQYRETRDHSGKLKERFRVGTVDAFQGKEFDIVILSMTRSNDFKADEPKLLRRKYGHLMLENRLCVAMSRQQRLLIVVGDSAMLEGEPAAQNVLGLVRFYELCGGQHGVRLHA